MSKRKATLKVTSVSDTNDRQSTRKSNRISRRLTSDSPIKSSNQSPISAKDGPNLSQYFPSRKRSQSSPRNQSPLDKKYTRLKSPNTRFRKRLLADNPITYGEFEHSFDENSSQELSETPKKVKVKPSVEPNVCHKTQDKSCPQIDFRGLLSTFQSVMDEVVEDDMEVTAADNSTDIQSQSSEHSFGINGLANMISSLDTKADNSFLSPIPCHSRDIELHSEPKIKSINTIRDQRICINKAQEVAKKDIQTKVEPNCCETKQNDSNCFEDELDDDFNDIVCDMTFNFEQSVPTVNCVQKEETLDNKHEIKESFVDTTECKTEEDDGFESDGDFERCMSQIPNEQLGHALDESDSIFETSARNLSTSSCCSRSSGLITLSQIIDLINKD